MTSFKDEELGRWPRRLLHVPTMTSHPWQPGNKYGTHISPAYNVISYTWGRFELLPAEQPHVPPLRIHNIPWPIPRINPAHFSAADLHAAIRSAASLGPLEYRSYELGGPVTKSRVEHVWLDIACIDQAHRPTKMAEVGRQSTIFAHALTAVVWLNRHSGEELRRLVLGFADAMEELDVKRESAEGALAVAAQALDRLVQDPWFESLWTLQEAFLRKDAVLLSKEGKWVEGTYLPRVELRLLTTLCSEIHYMENGDIQKLSPWMPVGDLKRFQEVAKRSGLGFLHADNPIVLYSVAHLKQTKRPLDRVYGIMQVFGFRLGSSRPGEEEREFTIEELEEQLGRALLEKWPLRSQSHIYTKPAEFGKAWMVNESCQFPEAVQEFEEPMGKDYKSELCQLSTVTKGGKTWGSFKGKAAKIHDMAVAWRESSFPGPNNTSGLRRPIQMLALDATEALEKAPAWYHGLNQLSLPLDETQHRVSELLVHLFGDDLVVLRLSPARGLLLLCRLVNNDKYWHRIGICVWYTKETSDSFLHDDEDPKWSMIQGIFG